MTLLDFPQSCPILTKGLLMPPKLQPPVKVSNPSVTESSRDQRHTWTPQYPILRLPTFASYPDRASNPPNNQFPRAFEFCAKMRIPPKSGRIEKRRTPNLLLNQTIRKRVSIDKIDPDFVDSSFFEMLRLKRRESNGSTSSTSSDSSSASLTACVYDNSHLYPEHTCDPVQETDEMSDFSREHNVSQSLAPSSTASSILTIFENQQF